MAALLFDFGGTLVNQEVFLDRARDAAIARLERVYGIPPVGREGRRVFDSISRDVWAGHQAVSPRKREQLVKREAISSFVSSLHLAADADRIDDVYRALVRGAVESPCVFAGASEMLSDLSKVYDMAIVSNGLAQYTWECLDRNNLTRFFPVRLISEETDVEKPDPRIFREAMDGLGAQPQETVMIGNMLYEDILGARNAGIRSIWLNRHEPQRPNNVRADFEISDILELPAALMRVFPRRDGSSRTAAPH